MKSPLTTVVLTITVLLGDTSGTYALPNCFGSPNTNWFKAKGDAFSSGWSSCVGVYTDKYGNKYSGEWRDSKMHGQGTLTYASGRVKVGICEYGRLTAPSSSSPPSISPGPSLSMLMEIERQNSKARQKNRRKIETT